MTSGRAEMEGGLRPQSRELVDLHVSVVPPEYWIQRLNYASQKVLDETFSAGFVRIHPNTTIFLLRKEIEKQIGSQLFLAKYVFLRHVGRCLALVHRNQEDSLKAKDFVPPRNDLPEICILPSQPPGYNSNPTLMRKYGKSNDLRSEHANFLHTDSEALVTFPFEGELSNDELMIDETGKLEREKSDFQYEQFENDICERFIPGKSSGTKQANQAKLNGRTDRGFVRTSLSEFTGTEIVSGSRKLSQSIKLNNEMDRVFLGASHTDLQGAEISGNIARFGVNSEGNHDSVGEEGMEMNNSQPPSFYDKTDVNGSDDEASTMMSSSSEFQETSRGAFFNVGSEPPRTFYSDGTGLSSHRNLVYAEHSQDGDLDHLKESSIPDEVKHSVHNQISDLQGEEFLLSDHVGRYHGTVIHHNGDNIRNDKLLVTRRFDNDKQRITHMFDDNRLSITSSSKSEQSSDQVEMVSGTVDNVMDTTLRCDASNVNNDVAASTLPVQRKQRDIATLESPATTLNSTVVETPTILGNVRKQGLRLGPELPTTALNGPIPHLDDRGERDKTASYSSQNIIAKVDREIFTVFSPNSPDLLSKCDPVGQNEASGVLKHALKRMTPVDSEDLFKISATESSVSPYRYPISPTEQGLGDVSPALDVDPATNAPNSFESVSAATKKFDVSGIHQAERAQNDDQAPSRTASRDSVVHHRRETMYSMKPGFKKGEEILAPKGFSPGTRHVVQQPFPTQRKSSPQTSSYSNYMGSCEYSRPNFLSPQGFSAKKFPETLAITGNGSLDITNREGPDGMYVDSDAISLSTESENVIMTLKENISDFQQRMSFEEGQVADKHLVSQHRDGVDVKGSDGEEAHGETNDLDQQPKRHLSGPVRENDSALNRKLPLWRELHRVRERRKHFEKLRQDVMGEAKIAAKEIVHKRAGARDVWKRRFYNEKKKATLLRDVLSRLGHQHDSFSKKLPSSHSSVLLKNKKSMARQHERPSLKINSKIMAVHVLQSIADLKRRLNDAKSKLAAEVKMRFEAEQEVKQMKQGLLSKKIQSHVAFRKITSLKELTAATHGLVGKNRGIAYSDHHR